jgi:anchored repeat ABC transporter substrate-binding protein
VRRHLSAALAVTLLIGAGCDRAAGAGDGGLRVVTTTEILADLVRQVGGDKVTVDSIVPSGGDPHSYEPNPGDAVKVSKADVTFTNHLLLEPHGLIKTIDTNIKDGASNVSLAEVSESYGATVIPLVENIGLDVLWLGLAVRGDGEQRGATRSSDILLSATALDGPGHLAVYLTQTLGEPEVYVNSADGLDAKDSVSLPPAAHTHVNWAFSKPGIYRLTLRAALRTGGGVSEPAGEGTFTFAVGVDPHSVRSGATILGDGHTDIAVDLDSGQIYAYSDVASASGDAARKQASLPAGDVVIDVPNKAIETVPDDPRFGFIGVPGTRIHQLPQAVLGKHVHGEIDPHLWEDVRNAKSYAQLIRDALVKADPDSAATYRDNARRYLATLDELDEYVRGQIGRIPADRRQLITTHDAFGYLAKAYDMTVAGFVVPNPAQEPSAAQVTKLTETIRNLRVPAVFVEPHLANRAAVLTQVAKDQGVRICKLYGDSFDEHARSYVDMMRHNADELRDCLGGSR